MQLVSYFMDPLMQMAKSFVMDPDSIVEMHVDSRASQNFRRGSLLSSFARWSSPLVHAKIEAMGLVEVSFPCW